MFKLIPDQQIRRKVEVNLPYDTGDQPKKAVIFATFRIVKKSVKKARDQEVARLTKQARDYIQGNEDELEVSTVDKEGEYLTEDLVNLEGIQDPESDDDLAFDSELLETLLEIDHVREALMIDWKKIQNNSAFKKAEKAKN